MKRVGTIVGNEARVRDGRAPALTRGTRARVAAPRVLVGVVMALAVATTGRAAEAVDTAPDPQLEARVQRIAAELRCLVCQNQTIADSNASLAVDLRNQVREQLRAGRNEAQISAYMTERYGDFVLYRPPLKATTVALWSGPFVALLVAVLVLSRRLRRHGADVRAAEPADTTRERRARALLEDDRR